MTIISSLKFTKPRHLTLSAFKSNLAKLPAYQNLKVDPKILQSRLAADDYYNESENAISFLHHGKQIFENDHPWELKEPVAFNEDLAEIIEKIDSIYTKDLAISSLMINRMVNLMTTNEEWSFGQYYFHLFRHSPCSNHFREWTALNWIIKGCTIEQGQYMDEQIQLMIELLQNKPQYGIFPPPMGYNILLEHLDNHPRKGDDSITAWQTKMVEICFLDEVLDTPSTAVLCGQILCNYLKNDPNFEKLDDVQKRNLAGALLRISETLQLENSSKLAKDVLNNLEKTFSETSFRKMYLKPFAPIRHVPEFVNVNVIDQDTKDQLVESVIEEIENFVNSEDCLKLIQMEHVSDHDTFEEWYRKLNKLCNNEKEIYNNRVEKEYLDLIKKKLDDELQVATLRELELWKHTQPSERDLLEQSTINSNKLLTECLEEAKTSLTTAGYAIHDLDLECEDPFKRTFDRKGGAESFAQFKFSNQPVEYPGDRKVAIAQMALRSGRNWLKDVDTSDLAPGIYDIDGLLGKQKR